LREKNDARKGTAIEENKRFSMKMMEKRTRSISKHRRSKKTIREEKARTVIKKKRRCNAVNMGTMNNEE